MTTMDHLDAYEDEDVARAYFRHSLLSLFLAGAASVLLFNQGAVAILNVLGYTPPPFSYAAFPLFAGYSVPTIWAYAFLGGIFGLIFGVFEKIFSRGLMYYISSALFGIIFPSLIVWYVVLPLRGQAPAYNYDQVKMAIDVIVFGMWGLGTGLLLTWHTTRSPR